MSMPHAIGVSSTQYNRRQPSNTTLHGNTLESRSLNIMTTSTSASTIHSSSGLSCRGLLALSPELVVEIASHIGRELSPASTNAYGLSTDASENQGKLNVASLRLVCRYLSEVLEHLVFKSISFDFGRIEQSESRVESKLLLLSKGGSAVSRYTTQLSIKSLYASRRRFPGYINDSEQIDGKTSALMRILDVHLENAILSLSNLRSIM